MAENRLDEFRGADTDAGRRLGHRLAEPQITVQVGLDEPGLAPVSVDAELDVSLAEGLVLLDNRLARGMQPVEQSPVCNRLEIGAPFHQVALFFVGAARVKLKMSTLNLTGFSANIRLRLS